MKKILTNIYIYIYKINRKGGFNLLEISKRESGVTGI